MRLSWRTSTEPERTQRSDHGVVQRDGLAISYRVVRSARRRKTLELSVEAEGVRVAAPLWASDAEVARFVHSKVPWILKHGRRPTADVPRPPLYRDGGSMSYLGRTFPLVVEDRALRRVQVTMDLLGVHIAVPRRLQEPARQAAIETAIRNWYRDRALEEVPYRVERWSVVLGESPSRVLIRDQRRRWGSCAPDRTLRFNWRLAMLEPGLIDYVIVHELCHLRHPNHGAGFWAEVGRLMPDWRLRRAALVRAGRALPF